MPVLEEKERSASYKPVFVTEITDDLHFYVQDVETGEHTPGPVSTTSRLLAWGWPTSGPPSSGRGRDPGFQGPPCLACGCCPPPRPLSGALGPRSYSQPQRRWRG